MTQKKHEVWLWEAIVEHIPTMIFVKDAEFLRFELFNKAGEDLLGFSRHELYGKSDSDFFPKEQADFFNAKDREVLIGGTPVSVEEPIKTQSGDRWLFTKKVPILHADGTPLYLLGISLDITERRQAEQELKKTLQQLSELEPLVIAGKSAAELGTEIIKALDAGDTATARALAEQLSQLGKGIL